MPECGTFCRKRRKPLPDGSPGPQVVWSFEEPYGIAEVLSVLESTNPRGHFHQSGMTQSKEERARPNPLPAQHLATPRKPIELTGEAPAAALWAVPRDWIPVHELAEVGLCKNWKALVEKVAGTTRPMRASAVGMPWYLSESLQRRLCVGEDIDNFRLAQIAHIEKMKDQSETGVQMKLLARLLRVFKLADTDFLDDYTKNGRAAVLGQIARCLRWPERLSPEVFSDSRYKARLEELLRLHQFSQSVGQYPLRREKKLSRHISAF